MKEIEKIAFDSKDEDEFNNSVNNYYKSVFKDSKKANEYFKNAEEYRKKIVEYFDGLVKQLDRDKIENREKEIIFAVIVTSFLSDILEIVPSENREALFVAAMSLNLSREQVIQKYKFDKEKVNYIG